MGKKSMRKIEKVKHLLATQHLLDILCTAQCTLIATHCDWHHADYEIVIKIK